MESDNGDLQGVVEVAALLRVSEFEVFRLAYRQWFGQPPLEPALKAPFQGYLQTAVAPAWVRAFVRQVLALQREGNLDPRALGVPPVPPATTRSVVTGVAALIGLCLLVALLVHMIVVLQDAMLARCLFPPCY